MAVACVDRYFAMARPSGVNTTPNGGKSELLLLRENRLIFRGSGRSLLPGEFSCRHDSRTILPARRNALMLFVSVEQCRCRTIRTASCTLLRAKNWTSS